MNEALCARCGHGHSFHHIDECIHVTDQEYDCDCDRFRFSDDIDTAIIAKLTRELELSRAETEHQRARAESFWRTLALRCDAYETLLIKLDDLNAELTELRKKQ